MSGKKEKGILIVKTIIQRLIHRWHCESGYREVLVLAIPLILSTGAWTIQHFVDRMFLTWYSPEAIAASLPAGMVNWTITSLFVGTAAYVNTFVAQYYGAKRYQNIGPSVWQGIYLSIIVIILVLIILPFTNHFFQWIGHSPEVSYLENIYFRILLIGAPLTVINHATTGFFTGRGKTWIVMWINVVATGINIILDYLWIFGNLGFPEMGIEGAGWATVSSYLFATLLFFVFMIKPKFNTKYHTLKGFKFNYK